MVFKRQVEGDVNRVEKARVAVYSCPIEIFQTDTKGTALIKSGQNC
jgi:T-complex protein 1 subunit theta